jgi:hypothetical protein
MTDTQKDSDKGSGISYTKKRLTVPIGAVVKVVTVSDGAESGPNQHRHRRVQSSVLGHPKRQIRVLHDGHAKRF